MERFETGVPRPCARVEVVLGLSPHMRLILLLFLCVC